MDNIRIETLTASFSSHRFYFLSNVELIDVISQARDPHMVKIHLRKCFDSIAELDFVANVGNDSSCSIRAMISPEGERIEFVAVSLLVFMN